MLALSNLWEYDVLVLSKTKTAPKKEMKKSADDDTGEWAPK